jgi:pilus assembly protein CpaB
LLLVAAFVVAALGTLLVFVYVDRVDERALKDQQPVEVLVAKTRIAAGTTAQQAEQQGAFRLQRIPVSATVPGYLRDPRPISGRVAVSDIFPGEQIVPEKFAEPGATSALPIPDDRLATSVQLGDPQRVAGFVAPGSDVAVFVTIDTPPVGGRPGREATRLLLPKAGVIAVGPTTLRPSADGEGNQESVPTAILTLAVTQAEAEKLVYAAENGNLWFALRTKDSKVEPGPGTDITTLFD